MTVTGKRHLIGKKVRVEFDYPKSWPVRYGRYEYQGFDDNGHWVVRPDGAQRYILNSDIVDIKEVDDDDA